VTNPDMPADIAAAIDAVALTERTVGVALGNRATNFANGPHRHAADAARAALDAAILKHLEAARWCRPEPRLFTCPKCGSERGWLPQCMQDGCPVLGLEGEEVGHAE
jgi:hypothetical protein